MGFYKALFLLCSMFVSSLCKVNPFKSPTQKYPCSLFTSCSSPSSISCLYLSVLCHSRTNKSLCAENSALGYPELIQILSGILWTNCWGLYLYFSWYMSYFACYVLHPCFFFLTQSVIIFLFHFILI